ncbi:MAG: ribonuclease P protein component [Saprospiraceae bacterium]|nr:ribonuclease P protein component [Lewinella sp.]
MQATFTKEERLKSRKVIQALFNRQGQSFSQYPLRLVWMPMEERRSAYAVQFAVSVPKRRFKKAVARNRLRRQIRETYRLQKTHLYKALEEHETQYAFMILFVGQEMLPYDQLEKAMQLIIRRFLKKVKSNRREPTDNTSQGSL